MDIKLKLKRLDAIQVYDCVRLMTGSASYQLLRQEVRKKIEEVWPEILPSSSPLETQPDEIREILITGREQRSLAEGYIELLNRKDQFGSYTMNTDSFAMIQRVCKISKVWNWVKSKIEMDEVLEFDEPLDDEPPLLDSEQSF